MRAGGGTVQGCGTEKKGGETKIFKKGGGSKLGQGVGALKKGGGWNPLTNYEGVLSSTHLALFISWSNLIVVM